MAANVQNVTDEIRYHMGWLHVVGSSKSQFSFTKEPYERDYILTDEIRTHIISVFAVS